MALSINEHTSCQTLVCNIFLQQKELQLFGEKAKCRQGQEVHEMGLEYCIVQKSKEVFMVEGKHTKWCYIKRSYLLFCYSTKSISIKTQITNKYLYFHSDMKLLLKNM
jgi:hypothetical protein